MVWNECPCYSYGQFVLGYTFTQQRYAYNNKEAFPLYYTNFMYTTPLSLKMIPIHMDLRK